MAATSSMFMYSLTLQPPAAATQAILGQFAGTKEQQIITACGSRLTLLKPDADRSKIKIIASHDVFGIIRCLSAFRLAGSNKDYIIIGSDSGRITIVEYIAAQNRFSRIHLETFGKSGVRRVIPGQYLVADPKGRACMIASVEKNKLVYVLNRNAQAELTISSPLEAHKPQTIIYALTSLDVGYENPIFAALEVDYGEADQDPSGQAYEESEKQLVYYELDLGLNHVVRKWSDTVDRTANLLMQVPGGVDGPSGVLVCGEENITYRHSNQDPFRVPIPRRRGATEDPNRKRYVTCGVMHKMRGAFFFLLQTEDGDMFKINIDLVEENGQPTGEVARLRMKYFDTVPVATSLCVLKIGYLYVACENGNNHFYSFEKLGDEEGQDEWSSDDFPADPTEPYQPVYFHPRPADNISLVESVDSLNPTLDCKVLNLTDDDAPQIYTACGSGARSTFRTLKHGLEVTDIVASELPAPPVAIWTTKRAASDEYDQLIVLSFANDTLVLSIGETVEQVDDTGFLSKVPTLAVQLLGEDALIQVHTKGIRLVKAGGQINDWPVPQHRTIVAATTNERQVAIALSSGEIVYFEMEPSDGSLSEYDERREMSGTVTCLSLGEVPPGRLRSSFLAVGCDDSTVRILSLDPDSTLENKSVQALTAAPSALNIMPMADSASGGQTLYLHIGLHSGVYLRTVLDEVTGELSDTRTRFLGPRPVKLFRVSVKEEPAVLALSSRCWLGHSEPQTKVFMLTPLDYSPLDWASNFSSEQCPEGMVGVSNGVLRIFNIDKLSNNLLQQSIPLQYTPRHFCHHPEHPLFYVIQSDCNILASSTRRKLLEDPKVVNGDAAVLPAEDFGYPRGKGHWASCIQVVDPVTDKAVTCTIELEDNEAAVSVAAVTFAGQDNQTFLVVGTGKDMVVTPPSHSAAYIHIYAFEEDGRSLSFIHKTKVESPPRALRGFQGRMLAGVGKDLRVYDLGVKQLLRKSQLVNAVPNLMVGIATQGSRIICSDVTESLTYCVYKFSDNRLISFCDDSIPRHSTCAPVMVDYETSACGDRFGNLWLVRCPPKVSEGADEEGGGAHLLHDKGYLMGTGNRLELMVHFFTQDIPTSIQKTNLVAGGREILLWSGLQGTLGIMIPFMGREDVDFFQNLETEMRKEDPPLAGRDHLIYRGYYVPCKGVIDGDLCERYILLKRDVKEKIAAELERSVREVERKVQDMRTRVAF